MKILSKTNLENQLIKYNLSVGDINTEIKEGKLLIAALAKLTTESTKGRNLTPQVILYECVRLANAIYHYETVKILGK